MAPPSNENPASAGTSRTSGGTTILTPPSSSASHASAAGSNYTAAADQPAPEPSYQQLAYQAQSATQDGSLYERLVSQPQAGDLAGRIAFFTARAKDTADRFDRQFQPRQG